VLPVALIVALLAFAPDASAATYGSRLGSHSMLYLNSTPAQHEALFRAAAEANLRYLRMDFAVGLVFAWDRTDFTAVERVDALSVKYRVRVLGVITETPWYIAECPGVRFELLGRCPPAARHAATWRRMVFEIVRRARHVRHWELGNEPNDPRTFIGDPAAYALWAALAAAGVRAARRAARIAIGGFTHLDRDYIRAVLHDPVNPLLGRFDIANVHVRAPLRSLRVAAARARAFFAREGFSGRLWVTETGYPSLAEHQWDPQLRGGEADQARWMRRGPRLLLAGGADAVFVAFRDSPEFGTESAYASEGVVRWPELDGGRAIPKPAFWALRDLAARVLPAKRRAADLAARGPGEVAREVDDARVLVGRGLGLHVVLELAREVV